MPGTAGSQALLPEVLSFPSTCCSPLGTLLTPAPEPGAAASCPCCLLKEAPTSASSSLKKSLFRWPPSVHQSLQGVVRASLEAEHGRAGKPSQGAWPRGVHTAARQGPPRALLHLPQRPGLF